MVIATLCDLNICAIFGSCYNSVASERHSVFIVKAAVFVLCCLFFVAESRVVSRFDRFCDLGKSADSDDGINFGDLFEYFFSVTLCKAAANDDTLEVFVFFEPRDVENVVDGFFFRAFDKRAGVDYDYVRFGFVACYLVACCGKRVKHNLGVNSVFRATERNKTDLYFL